jgi:hypothetical protein
MTSQRYPIGTPIFQPSVGTSSSSSSGASLDRDSIEDYHEIGGSVYWNSTIEAHRIRMVGPARAPSQNSSSRDPTIRESEASDARTQSNRVVRNLNPDIKTVQLQAIMESIQCMVPQDSSLVALAEQGAKAVGQSVVAEPSAGNQQGELFIENRMANQVKRARSEEASPASGNRCLADNDAHRQITQNHRHRKYGHYPTDLYNIIDDGRCLRARPSSPQWHSPT